MEVSTVPVLEPNRIQSSANRGVDYVLSYSDEQWTTQPIPNASPITEKSLVSYLLFATVMRKPTALV